MNKKPYTKKALAFTEQVDLLISRGMEFQDEAKAAFYLSHINYYRLTAYWLPFEQDHTTHQFRAGTTFDKVLNLYVFDRELRLLVMDALERIEVSFRTQWAFNLGTSHGTHSHLDPEIASKLTHWAANLQSLHKEVTRSREVFISHFRQAYSEEFPPVWVVTEVMSLGLLSRWYTNLKPKQTRRGISSFYSLDEGLLESWLHHLTVIRNICAHHGCLWNRNINVGAKHPKKPTSIAEAFQRKSQKIYNSLLIILHFMDRMSPNNHWRQRFNALLERHQPPVDQMGFPKDWENQPIWKGSVQ